MLCQIVICVLRWLKCTTCMYLDAKAVRQQQTDFVFCFVCLEPQVSGCAFDLLAFFFPILAERLCL